LDFVTTAVAHEWQAVLAAVRENIPPGSFDTWFAPIQAIEVTPDRLRLGVANLYFKEWLEKNYAGVVADAAERVSGVRPAVEFTVSPKAFREFRQKQEAGFAGLSSAGARRIDASAASTIDGPAIERPKAAGEVRHHSFKQPRAAAAVPQQCSPGISLMPALGRLNPEYTFERFVVGPSNRLAWAACRAVLEAPATSYNPLYMYSSPGLGKTHLLQALAGALRARYPSFQVVCCSCEAFTNEYVRAAQENRLTRFRALFRGADALLMDDLQFLASKARTQEEFLHALDALLAAGRQVVFTADTHPKGLAGLPQKLVTRLAGGLVAHLDAPNLETRCDMLRAFSAQRGIGAPPEAIDLIARRITSTVRELEGALVKYRALTAAEGHRPDLPAMRKALRELTAGPGGEGPLTMDRILAAVADETGLAANDICSASRARSVLRARQTAMYLAKELTRFSLSEIGAFFGGKSHATVLHSHGKMVRMLPRDERLAVSVTRLRDILAG
jgi:chromosomal replication initiator protein